MHARRASLYTFLVLLPAVSWVWIVVLARDMYGDMTGASAWMMTPHWDRSHLALLWLMWAVMMIAMMLPSAVPMIVLVGHGATDRTSIAPANHILLAAGYLAAWALFSIGATALQWWLGRLLIVTPMMEVSTRHGGAALVAFAGVYQWTPLKDACLTACRSPLALLTTRWRSGSWGAFRMGLDLGVYCVGCCWALMLLLFAGGVMNLAAIGALTLFVAFEKLAPWGRHTARISGGLLILTGAWMLV